MSDRWCGIERFYRSWGNAPRAEVYRFRAGAWQEGWWAHYRGHKSRCGTARFTSGYVGYVCSLHLLELAGIKPPGEPLAAVAPLRSGPFTGLCPEGV